MKTPMITNTKPKDPADELIAGIVNAVQAAVRDGISKAIAELEGDGEQVETRNNTQGKPHNWKPPAADVTNSAEPGWHKAGFRTPKSEG